MRILSLYLGFCAAVFLAGGVVWGQETRSMLFGRVLDPSGAAVVGAAVAVRNAETGVTLNLKTNDTGYYEANLLLPGQYEVSAESSGFKKLIRRGITLPVSSRIQIDMQMEIGGVTETVLNRPGFGGDWFVGVTPPWMGSPGRRSNGSLLLLEECCRWVLAIVDG